MTSSAAEGLWGTWWLREQFTNNLGLAVENRGVSSKKRLETWEVVGEAELSEIVQISLFLRCGRLNYSWHTRLSSSTRRNDADRGRVEKSPWSGGNLLGQCIQIHTKIWDISERSVQTDTYKVVTRDKYGNLTKKRYIHLLVSLILQLKLLNQRSLNKKKSNPQLISLFPRMLQGCSSYIFFFKLFLGLSISKL